MTWFIVVGEFAAYGLILLVWWIAHTAHETERRVDRLEALQKRERP